MTNCDLVIVALLLDEEVAELVNRTKKRRLVRVHDIKKKDELKEKKWLIHIVGSKWRPRASFFKNIFECQNINLSLKDHS